MRYIPAITKLIDEFSRLPGIGRKTAQRLAFYIVDMEPARAHQFAEAILDAKRKVHYCERCFNLTEESLCDICSDPKRDPALMCVVETPRDLIAVENTKEYNGD
ncbi:MAG: recombination protein RecR [Clostridiales bacterium]|nr:recombination protein RecR [Clostridiales bacterium]